MKSIFADAPTVRRGRRRPARRPTVRPTVELLEDRTVPSAVLGPDGVLTVVGSEEADDMQVSPGPNPCSVALFGVPDVQDGTVFNAVSGIKLYALGGDDHVRAVFSDDDDCTKNPHRFVSGGYDFDWIEVTVVIGAVASSQLVVDAGEGNNQTSIHFVDGTQGQHPKTRPGINIDYRSGGGADTLVFDYQGPLDVDSEFVADTGGGNDKVQVNIHPVVEQGGDPVQPPPNEEPHEPPPMPPPDAVYKVVVATGGGQDSADFDVFLPRDPCVIVADFGIDTGVADDVLDFRFFSGSDFLDLGVAVATGAGQDSADFDVFFPTGPCLIVADFGIDTAAGDDVLGFKLNSGADFLDLDVTATLGTGHDSTGFDVFFPTGPCQIVADFGIDLGSGEDVLGFKLSSTAEMVDLGVQIHGGNGADTISARFNLDPATEGSLDVALEGDNGDDDLALAVFGADGLDELFALLDGGYGFDTGRATGNVLVKNVEKFELIGQ